MIISAFNREEVESVLLSSLNEAGIDFQESPDRHLGQSWEASELPNIPGYVWNKSIMFGVQRYLLKPRPLSENEMLEIVAQLSFQKSSVFNEMTADFPIDFNEVCKLPFVKRVQRGWTTLRATWNAPDGQEYIFRMALSGTQGYSYISKGE